MTAMTPDECRDFLLGTVRTAKLATVRPDGRPHVVPVWFDLDEHVLVFTMWHQTVKAANIRRDPRVCVCVDDETAPFGYVQIEGAATILTDMARVKYWTARIAGRYMGIASAEAYGARYGVEGELLVRLTPDKMIGQKDVVS
jgi:PPOX class probable F420-dependent enzyme